MNPRKRIGVMSSVAAMAAMNSISRRDKIDIVHIGLDRSVDKSYSAFAAVKENGEFLFLKPSTFVGGQNVGKSVRSLLKPFGTSATGSISKVERKTRNQALKRAKQSRKKNRQ